MTAPMFAQAVLFPRPFQPISWPMPRFFANRPTEVVAYERNTAILFRREIFESCRRYFLTHHGSGARPSWCLSR